MQTPAFQWTQHKKRQKVPIHKNLKRGITLAKLTQKNNNLKNIKHHQSQGHLKLQLTTKLLAPTTVFPLNSSIAPSPKPCYYDIRINHFIKPMLVSSDSHLQL